MGPMAVLMPVRRPLSRFYSNKMTETHYSPLVVSYLVAILALPSLHLSPLVHWLRGSEPRNRMAVPKLPRELFLIALSDATPFRYCLPDP